MTNSADQAEPVKVEFNKPAKALFFFYKDISSSLRNGQTRDASVYRTETLRDIAKKILENPNPPSMGVLWHSSAPEEEEGVSLPVRITSFWVPRITSYGAQRILSE